MIGVDGELMFTLLSGMVCHLYPLRSTQIWKAI